MPGRWTCALIIVFWIFATVRLVQRDVIPALGVGALTYDRVLSSRAVEEPVEWDIFRDKKNVGHLFFVVHPESDGTFQLQSRANFSVEIPGLEDSDFYLSSVIDVDPLKRLRRFVVILSLSQSSTEVRVEGNVEGKELKVQMKLVIAGTEQLQREATFGVDPNAMMLDLFGQIDRLPDLRDGKTWRTRFINPMTVFLTGNLNTADGLDYIQHTVVGTEIIEWNHDIVKCYKIEHRYQRAVTYSWARPDGKVLVQEVVFSGVPFRLVAEPSLAEQIRPSTPEKKNDGR